MATHLKTTQNPPLHAMFRFLQQVRRCFRGRFSPFTPPPCAFPSRSPRFVSLPHPTQRTRIQVLLFDQPTVRLEGVIAGFDEYMNLVLEGAEEVAKGKAGGAERRSALGRLLLKGDNITAIAGLPAAVAAASGGGEGGGGGGADAGGEGAVGP